MPFDARFLASSAIDYARRRGARLRAVTVGGLEPQVAMAVGRELVIAGVHDVEVSFELSTEGTRVLAVELDSGDRAGPWPADAHDSGGD